VRQTAWNDQWRRALVLAVLFALVTRSLFV
jgi:hypothetical protein